ncbi:MAG: haloacid dehalogenase-like hydrolase, partial [Candidatus Geothermarchaeales archaeon]
MAKEGSEGTRVQHVVVSDFDGTIVEKDLPELVLKRFGEKGWERYDTLLVEGKLGLEECIKQQYGMIRAESEEQILGYIRDHCAVRPGFHELVEFSRERGVELVVASAGLD